jgi:hypothetical protein
MKKMAPAVLAVLLMACAGGRTAAQEQALGDEPLPAEFAALANMEASASRKSFSLRCSAAVSTALRPWANVC